MTKLSYLKIIGSWITDMGRASRLKIEMTGVKKSFINLRQTIDQPAAPLSTQSPLNSRHAGVIIPANKPDSAIFLGPYS